MHSSSARSYEACCPTAYMEFIYDRLKVRNPDGSLQIMYTIHGRLIAFLSRSLPDDFVTLKRGEDFP